MVDIPRSSFIPKETSGLTPDRIRRGHTFHVFGFIGTAILVGSLLSAGLVFFLRSSANSDLEDAKRTLSEQKDLFRPEHVSEVQEFDRRLKAAEVLIQNHVSPSRIFGALEEKTKQRIQFTAFALERTSANEVLVSLTGKTEEFKTLALQASDFENDDILRDVVFSEVSTSEGDENAETEEARNERGVVFTLMGNVNATAIKYDGQPLSVLPQTHFIETNDMLLAVDELVTEEGGKVLGESITNDSL
jgi:hypothetical protein